jgi:hypothetical protein
MLELVTEIVHGESNIWFTHDGDQSRLGTAGRALDVIHAMALLLPNSTVPNVCRNDARAFV